MKTITKLSILTAIYILAVDGILSQTCPNNVLPNGYPTNAGIQATLIPKKLTIGGNALCPDVAFMLRYDPEYPYFGIIALTTPYNFNEYSYIPENPVLKGDMVISAQGSKHIVITTRDTAGKIRFATTPPPPLPPFDIERMTITPEGMVGVSDTTPKNLFSVKNTTGLDFWNDNINYQDIRFNCYDRDPGGDSPADTSLGDNPVQSHHFNIQAGHSTIIQSKTGSGHGTLLMAVSQNNTADSQVEFFETTGGQPKGIILQNYSASTNIGLGSLTDEDTRVKILGRTSDNTTNALKVVNWDNNSLFRIRNDGYIFLEKADSRLHINGMVCAKEVTIQLSGTPCWPDYVFNDNYNLLPLDDLEKRIKKDKHLPGIPSAKEVENNGLQLGEMQSKLLKKIEELTLYVIELKKENDRLGKRINNFESKKIKKVKK